MRTQRQRRSGASQFKRFASFLAFVGLLAGSGGTVCAAEPPAAPIGMPTPSLAPPRDADYPGVIQLQVDATDVRRRIFDVRQTIPVAKPGRLALLYPKWIPGGHTSLQNSLHLMGGLTITTEGRPVPWVRDPVEVTAFHVEVPEGVSLLDLRFQFLTPVEPKIGRIVMTAEMLNLQWLSTAFYPAGHYVNRIRVEARLKLPEGWGFGCALETSSTAEGWVRFKPTTFEMLMDSPVFAGRHYARHTLSQPGEPPVHLNLVADSAEFLEADPKHIDAHRQLVSQARRLFGARHYDRYEFLVALTDQLGRIGLEHHRSSENRVVPEYFTEWDQSFVGRHLLPHELTHSWNGKFRRPAGLGTPDYQTPMRNSLLWVYEGATTYWGEVLAARSAIMTAQQVRELLAIKAATLQGNQGREWRNLLDTTSDPILANRRPLPWDSYQRSEDYYPEGQLIWLDADTLIREKTGEAKSLDDFARGFFGIAEGSLGPVLYEFEDVVKALNAVVPHDWAAFLKSRVEGLNRRAPLDGLRRGGYQLVFTNEPTAFFLAAEKRKKENDFRFSLGLAVGEGGALVEVVWGSPAFQAGLTQGATLVAVHSESYDADRLKSAIKRAARPAAGPLELLVKDGSRYRTVKLDYHDGPRYPILERIPGSRARLDEILAPRE
jgi:predicted metalloprotease with PDZ domain